MSEPSPSPSPRFFLPALVVLAAFVGIGTVAYFHPAENPRHPAGLLWRDNSYDNADAEEFVATLKRVCNRDFSMECETDEKDASFHHCEFYGGTASPQDALKMLGSMKDLVKAVYDNRVTDPLAKRLAYAYARGKEGEKNGTVRWPSLIKADPSFRFKVGTPALDLEAELQSIILELNKP